MIRFILLLLFQFIFGSCILAQNNDTSSKPIDSFKVASTRHDSTFKTKFSRLPGDSFTPVKADSLIGDSISKQSLENSTWVLAASRYSNRNFIQLAFEQNKLFSFSATLLIIRSNKKEFKGKELLFYTLVALLLFFAFIRFSFSKYLTDLFRVVFRTTLKQRQIGEQLIQAPLPSLLLNFFFLITTSLYINFVLQHYYLTGEYNFWLLYFYCFVALLVIYMIKFLSLKLSGWLFNISETTDDYIFIVFMINKIIGIYLLPFLVLIAFTDNNVYQIAFALSYLGIFALLAYRIILSYGLVSNQIRVNPFHFFLYLCAFEIVPLLVIYKALMYWF